MTSYHVFHRNLCSTLLPSSGSQQASSHDRTASVGLSHTRHTHHDGATTAPHRRATFKTHASSRTAAADACSFFCEAPPLLVLPCSFGPAQHTQFFRTSCRTTTATVTETATATLSLRPNHCQKTTAAGTFHNVHEVGGIKGDAENEVPEPEDAREEGKPCLICPDTICQDVSRSDPPKHAPKKKQT